MNKKYRLLKDLPGCPRGTLFLYEAGDEFAYAANHQTLLTKMNQVRPSIADANPDWFQPIPDEPERPYPWEPEEGDRYFCLYLGNGLSEVTNYRSVLDVTDQGVHEITGAYRTKEDAELALKGLPMYNKAIQALINRQTVTPPDEHFEATGAYYICDDGRVYYPARSDAQAVADLFNFFLTTPSHEQR